METDESIKKRNNYETKLDKFWPGPQKSKCPILFCNVIGKEDDKKTGSKAAGGKKIGIDSKFNETEATKVVNVYLIALNDFVQDRFSRIISLTQVKIAETLCRVHKVPTHQIAVLTPYSAQKLLIDKMMKEANLTIKVASITESQGEH